MKIYKTQEEVDADIKDAVLIVNESVTFECSIKVEASLKIALNIIALNIDAWDIIALNIDAGNINAWNINAENINAGNINAWNINAENINAGDIKAGNIKAGDISFFAVAFSYLSFKCKSIVGRRDNSKYFCLDYEVEITGTNPARK